MRKTLILSMLFCLALPQNSHAASKSITGDLGQTLTASATMVANNAVITVTGKRFDETVGLYLAICVVPKKVWPLPHVVEALTKLALAKVHSGFPQTHRPMESG